MTTTLRLSPMQLRCLVSNAVGLDSSDDPAFGFSDHPDGCAHATGVSEFDEFSILVPLRRFLSARFGVLEDSIDLHWDDFKWQYSATVRGADLTSAEVQRVLHVAD